MKYKHVISLGSFCSVASEIGKIGLRDFSYPFDWLICDLSGVLNCISNGFVDILNYENLYQYRNYPNYYFDKKNRFHYYHDFSGYIPLKAQLPAVVQKYKKRVERFYKNIKEPTLFLRYIQNSDELKYLETNYDNVLAFLCSFNKNNDLCLISNSDIRSNILNIYYVDKDKNDTVARNFLNKNQELKRFLTSDIYDSYQRTVNMRYYKKHNSKVKKFIKKVF